MQPKKLDAKVVSLLTERLSDEFDAMYFYRAAASYCEGVGYLKAAAFFKKESEDESQHAAMIEKYLTDWNIKVEYPTIAGVEADFDGLVDILTKAYQIEYKLYEAYEDTAKKLFDLDLCAFDFTTPLRKIQNDSVAEYSTYLNRLGLIDSKDKFQVLWYEDHTF